jgi:hypothetical protein
MQGLSMGHPVTLEGLEHTIAPPPSGEQPTGGFSTSMVPVQAPGGASGTLVESIKEVSGVPDSIVDVVSSTASLVASVVDSTTVFPLQPQTMIKGTSSLRMRACYPFARSAAASAEASPIGGLHVRPRHT